MKHKRWPSQDSVQFGPGIRDSMPLQLLVYLWVGQCSLLVIHGWMGCVGVSNSRE